MSVLLGMLTGNLSPEVQEQASVHLALCKHCAERFGELGQRLQEEQEMIVSSLKFATLPAFMAAQPSRRMRKWINQSLKGFFRPRRQIRVAYAWVATVLVAAAISLGVLIPRVVNLQQVAYDSTIQADYYAARLEDSNAERARLEEKASLLVQQEEGFAARVDALEHQLLEKDSEIVQLQEEIAFLDGPAAQASLHEPFAVYYEMALPEAITVSPGEVLDAYKNAVLHRVVAGDSWKSLALQYLGDASLWPILILMNRDHIEKYRDEFPPPGTLLRVPPDPFAESPVEIYLK
jgi:hypothetical protein